LTLHKLLPLAAFLLNVSLAGITLARNRASRLNRVFAYFLAGLAIWNFGVFMLRQAPDPTSAYRWEIIIHVGLIVVPAFYYHFVLIFLESTTQHRRSLSLAYALALLLSVLNVSGSPLFMKGVTWTYWGWAPVIGPAYNVFFLYLNAFFIWGLVHLTKATRAIESSFRRNRARLIQIATDCVYSGAKGGYLESDAHDPLDVYGKTKSLGEPFDGSMLNVRCSIIGPELKGTVSLLEWFLANPDGAELNGFAHHRWNGVTTLQFAQLCETIIAGNAYEALLRVSHTHHFVPNDALDKFELLCEMQRAYGTKFRIRKVDNVGPPVDRTLASRFGVLRELVGQSSIAEALDELRRYVEARAAAAATRS